MILWNVKLNRLSNVVGVRGIIKTPLRRAAPTKEAQVNVKVIFTLK